jgi:hypothetical protein
MTFIDFSKRKSILILISYIITVAISRLTVLSIQNNFAPVFLKYNVVNNFHIHHFIYGIILLSAVGFISLFIPARRRHGWLFILYGVSLGLIFDEFGILVKLNPKYDEILSIIAIIFISVVLFISAFIEHRYRKIK